MTTSITPISLPFESGTYMVSPSGPTESDGLTEPKTAYPLAPTPFLQLSVIVNNGGLWNPNPALAIDTPIN